MPETAHQKRNLFSYCNCIKTGFSMFFSFLSPLSKFSLENLTISLRCLQQFFDHTLVLFFGRIVAPNFYSSGKKVVGKLNLDICRTLRQYLSSGHLCWKRHNKDCALIRTRRGDGAPVQLYNLLCNGKSKPRAASR